MKLQHYLLPILMLTPVMAQASTIVWDQGPSTGTFGGSWVNQTANQNFADLVNFNSNTLVGGLNYFTDYDLSSYTGSNAFHLKILSDVGGTPSLSIFEADIGFSNITAISPSINQLHFDFTPQLFSAGINYWVGISGNGFEAAQLSVRSPQDGQMAQFSGSAYIFKTGVGDQMYQLTSAVPIPAAAPLMLMGLGFLGFQRRGNTTIKG